ncbi:glycosyltransferase family protein [Salinimonas sediminis]|uniref:Glycosyltransferase family 1 protein n=1 Tax=Salinimonas sediminis TaxID=2303538 RepID=A0A346NJ30_9ALTE|nr:hypothetical protein [Salinimonas sediminis]AXR05537.1 hypothetical protein D0Y50_03605 [Salinimonas sediminis]
MVASKRLFLYPIEHSNGFIERTKGVFTELGYQLSPLKALFRPANVASRKHNSVVLNWYEDQPYRRGLHGIKRWIFIVGFIASLLSMRLFSANIIWLRHNFKPHNAATKTLLFNIIAGLMRLVAHRVVTLEMTPEIKSSVVKHPLYKPDAELAAFFNDTVNRPRTIDFLYFGSIKPYKRLDGLLKIWPAGVHLRIMGYCSDKAHTHELHQIINQRQLNVVWENAFIEQDALERAVADTRFVIIPHEDGAMISSGTFYMALSLGANVLCFDSAFARTKMAEFSFVQILDQTDLAGQLPALAYTSAGMVVEQAVGRYGDRAIKESWRVVLEG